MSEKNASKGVDVRLVRQDSGLTQQAFAKTFGFTLSAIRDWEQGRKKPDRAACILLAVVRAAPEAVSSAVTGLELDER